MMCFGRFLSLRQGGSRRQSESPRCLITNFRSGIGPDQSEWLTLRSNVSVGLIQWDCPWGGVIKPRSRCAPVRAYFRTLTSTCRSKSIIVRLKKIVCWDSTEWLPRTGARDFIGYAFITWQMGLYVPPPRLLSWPMSIRYKNLPFCCKKITKKGPIPKKEPSLLCRLRY